MLFNSTEFLVFFPIALTAFFLAPAAARRWVLLIASIWFSMSWKPACVAVLIAATLVAYGAALVMERCESRTTRSAVLAASLVVDAGILVVFKYLGFLALSLGTVLRWVGSDAAPPAMQLILPLGISFYTFKLLSYLIDVFRGTMRGERDFVNLVLYASFFPQVLAGPIERASRFMPQMHSLAGFDPARVTSGLRRMLWGLFKKVVVADHLAILVNQVYGNVHGYQGAPLIAATYLYAFQIFCDFSGYSDMAIGAARIMGIDTMENFRRPYHASSIADFWRRWHISLSSWFRDYLYIPLGGNRVAVPRWCVNVMVVFLISGLWHGAGWTFVTWGGLLGIFMVGERLTQRMRDRVCATVGLTGPVRRAVSIFITFHLVTFAWIFFRAGSLPDAWFVATHLAAGFGESLAALPNVFPPVDLAIGLAGIILVETVHVLECHAVRLRLFSPRMGWLRLAVYAALVLAVINLQPESKSPFLYMQF